MPCICPPEVNTKCPCYLKYGKCVCAEADNLETCDCIICTNIMGHRLFEFPNPKRNIETDIDTPIESRAEHISPCPCGVVHDHVCSECNQCACFSII